MNLLKRTWRRFVDWFRSPTTPYTDVDDKVHAEHERRRGVRGW